MTIASAEDRLSLGAFAEIAERAGLKLDNDELEVMREGYLGLLDMMTSLPDVEDVFVEPAILFVPLPDDWHVSDE